MNSNIRSVTVMGLVLLALLGFSNVDIVLAQSSEPGRKYSLEDSLRDLKRSAQELVQKSERISGKIDRLRNRIPELKDEVQKQRKAQRIIKSENERLQDQLRVDSKRSGRVDKNIKKIQNEINDIKISNSSIRKQKDRRQKEKIRLQNEVINLEEEVIDIERKLETGFDDNKQEFLREKHALLRELDETKQNVRKETKESERLTKGMEKPEMELEDFNRQRDELQNQLAMTRNEYQDEVDIYNQVQSELDQLIDKERKRAKLVTDDINAYDNFSREQTALINKVNDTHQMLSSQFRNEKGEYNKTIKNLEKANKLLMDKKGMLTESLSFNRLLKEQLVKAKNINTRIKKVNSDIIEIIKAHNKLKNDIKSGNAREVMLKKDISAAQKEVREIQKEVNASQKMTEAVLRKEERKYKGLMSDERRQVGRTSGTFSKEEKKLSGPLKELRKLQDHQRELKRKLAMVEGELREVMGETKKIEQENMGAAKATEGSTMQLKNEIRELELYGEELVNLMDVVTKKYNSRDIKGLQTAGEEKQLRKHVDSLKNENQNLQEEVLTLMVILDRLESGLSE